MKYLLAFALLLSGCAMSNDDMIRDVKKCEAAGMVGVPMASPITGQILEVQCWPKPPI